LATNEGSLTVSWYADSPSEASCAGLRTVTQRVVYEPSGMVTVVISNGGGSRRR